MPPSSQPVTAPSATTAKPRRWRKWMRRGLLGTGVVLAGVWLARVPLTNWALTKLPGFYAVRVDGVHPGWSGLAFSGVVVTHRPTGWELGRAERVEAGAAWGQLLEGNLDSLRLVKAHVTWRDEFGDYRMPYVEGAPPASPAVIWQRGEAEGGSFQWIERGQKLPRLSMDIVSLKGGKFTVFNDATSEATPQALVVSNLVSRELSAGGRLTILSTAPRAEGSMTGQQKEYQFTVDGLWLIEPLIQMEWLEQAQPGTIPEPVSTTAPASWDNPLMFRINGATASPGRVEMKVHQPGIAGPVEFSATLQGVAADGVRLAGGLPGIVNSISATLAEMKSPRAAAEWRELSLTGAYDEKGQFLVKTASVNGAKVTDSNKVLAALGFTPEEVKSLPLCQGGADAKCVNILLTEDGLSSPEPQEITLRDFTALLPGEKVPVASVPGAEIVAVPDEALRDRRLRRVVADKPALNIEKPETTAPDGTGRVENAAQASPEEKPGWFGWNVDSLIAREGSLKATGLGPGVPDTFAKFDIHTAPESAGGESLYQIRVRDIKLANPLLPAYPIPTGGVLDLNVHPLRFWEDGEVERAEFNGQEVDLNSSFMNLFKPPAGNPQDKTPAAVNPPPQGKPKTSWLPPLRVKKLVVNNVKLTLDDIGDGRRLTVPITGQEFTNVPLSADLLQHDAANVVQKIEVPAIYIYAPFEDGVTVLELPVNFIHFNFAGLAQKRLERVELVAPKIKAGSPLFDFFKVAQEKFSEFAVTAPPRPLLADAEKDSLPVQQALEAVRSTAAGKPAKWDIPVFTETGMIITAPRGEEWSFIPRLPFRNARVKEGPDAGRPIPFRLYGDEVTGELAIDEDWYDFPEWKLRLHLSGEGKIVFNYPLLDKNNNLVQVFQGNTLIYRDLRIENVWLSVTYDKEGIYASYGGETCGGYINGRVNLYLDQTYTWDASASLTGIDMKPFTSLLTREYVRMDGRVKEFNVVAHGDMNGLYQTTVNFTIPERGRLRLPGLDTLRQRLKKERVDWSDDAARVGVDMLRDFLFHSCEGSARLYGREGTIRIKLAGSEGVRDFNIHLHDYRHRRDKSIIRF